MNSESHMSVIADYCEGLGLKPPCFVDRKITDRTLEKAGGAF